MGDQSLIPDERIVNKIFSMRSRKVMLDSDLAELYNIETKLLNRAVKRNRDRFPADFMFQISEKESADLRFQNGTSSLHGGRRYLPFVFTEQGVAMLSSVLHSKIAIQVNIQIMRTFTRLRDLMATHEQLRRKIEMIEKKYDQNFKVVFEVIKQLLKEEEQPKAPIGFSLGT